MKSLVSAAALALILAGGLPAQEQTQPPARPSRGPRGGRPGGPRGVDSRTPESVRMNRTTSVTEAIEKGDMDTIDRYLKLDPLIANTKDRNGFTPLYVAAKVGRKDIAEMLLENGAEVDTEATDKNSTPLEVASLLGKKDVVEILIAHKASVNHQNADGETPTANAAKYNHDDVIEVLLANKADINMPDKQGHTPLDIAVNESSSSAADILAAHGGTWTNPAAQYFKAAAAGDLITIKKMLAGNPKLINEKNWDGNHAIHLAKTKLMAEALLAAGELATAEGRASRQPLSTAAEDGRVGVVELLLTKKVDVNAVRVDGATALALAAGKGQLAVVTMLLAHKADINAVDSKEQTPLDRAEAGKQTLVVAALRKQGALRGSAIKDMHSAAIGGDVEKLKALLAADPKLVESRDKTGATPLIIAAFAGKREAVEFLLAHKADVNATSASMNAIGWASQGGNKELSDYLRQWSEDHAPGPSMMHAAITKGDLDRVKKFVGIDPTMINKPFASWSPLQIAIREKQRAIVDYLIANKADVNSTDDQLKTPLHEAGWKGDPEVVAILLAHGAKLNAKDKNSNTPLDDAVAFGNYAVADALRAKGATGQPDSHLVFQAAGAGDVAKLKELIAADPKLLTLKNRFNSTALSKAAMEGKAEAVSYLLSKGADPNEADTNGYTPLMAAAEHKAKDAVAILLEKGANPKAHQYNGVTALHLADKDSAALLLDRGADINAKNSNDETALHSAAFATDQGAVELLVSRGADVNAVTKNGKTPLDLVNTVYNFSSDEDIAKKKVMFQFLRGKGAKLAKELQ